MTPERGDNRNVFSCGTMRRFGAPAASSRRSDPILVRLEQAIHNFASAGRLHLSALAGRCWTRVASFRR